MKNLSLKSDKELETETEKEPCNVKEASKLKEEINVSKTNFLWFSIKMHDLKLTTQQHFL